MASETGENVAVGELIGYGRVLNPFSKRSKVIVKANGGTIPVLVDDRQKKYLQRARRVGDKVAVGFYGGEWHIGMPPDHSGDFAPEDNISDLDLLQYELKGLDLIELVVRPLAARDDEKIDDFEPDNPVNDDIEVLKQRAVMNLILHEISERRDYIQKVEQNIKRNNDLILESLEKLGSQEMSQSLAEGEPGNATGGDGMETLKQKAMINLLLSDIDDHRDYLKEIELDVKKNSDALLEDLGLSHLKKDNLNKKMKQKAGVSNADTLNLEQAQRLDLVIAQNKEIISRLDGIAGLLKEMKAR